MKIGFDAKRAFLNNSGLGNYSRTLIKSLNQFYPKNNYTLFTTKKTGTNFEQFVLNKANFEVCEPQNFIAKKLNFLWRSQGITPLLNFKNIDVYHGLSNELPFNIEKFNGKKIVTVHDLIYLRFPDLYPFIDRKIYNKKTHNACKNADTIIAISEATKQDIIENYSISENKIKVIYQSCDEMFYTDFNDAQKKEVKDKFNLPHEFLFYVGTIEERKNLLLILKSLVKIKDIHLFVVGKKTNYYSKIIEYIKQNNLENRVHFLENVSNTDLSIIYQLATLFIFPSFFEGFGIPIIEALISKTPVISSTGSCFSEAGGPDSMYINPNNENELTEKINYLLANKQIRDTMSNKGFEYAEKFRAQKIATDLIDLYKS